MKLSSADIAVFAFYIVSVIALGIYASRKTKGTKRDYFLAGDKLPWWMVGGSIIAANTSSHHFVGIMGVAYTKGFSALNIVWPSIFISYNALLWIFLPYYLRNGFYTMPEFLNRRYGSAARTAYAGLIFLTYVFVEVAAVLYLGALAIQHMFDVPLLISIIVLAVLTGIYTITGGLRAVVWTEMLQLVVLIVGGLTLSFMTIQAVGGWSGMMSMSGDWHLILPATDQDFPWTMFVGASLGIGIFYAAANQFIVQRTLAAKNEWHARMGVVFTDYLLLFMPFVYIVPGLLAPKLFPGLEKGDLAFSTLVGNLLPTGIVGLVMAGLVAAIMSHISGSINACTTIACMDIYVPFINKKATDKQVVQFGKWVGVAIVIASIFWAQVMVSHSDKPIFIYLLNIYGYFAPGITSMFILGIFWKRATHAGALAAGALTIPLSFVLELTTKYLPDNIGAYISPFMNRTGIVFWACILTGVIVSLLTKPVPEENLKGMIWNVDSMKLPKADRAQMQGLKNPVIWWGIVMAIVTYLYIKFF